MTKKNSLLWEVQLKNQFKGYIFGTMHVPMNVAFSNKQLIFKAIDATAAFATEIPLDSQSQQTMGKHMHLPENVDLKSLISEKKYTKYSKVLDKSFGITLEPFNKVLPLFLLNYITQKALTPDDSAMMESMDFELWNYATAQNKVLTSVESIEDHIDTLYKIPLDYQLNAIKGACSNISKFRKKTHQMLEMYLNHDIHKLYQSSKKSLGAIKDVLLYRRNRIMIENYIKLSNEQTVFAAVGAAHLSGKKGLIHLMKQEGYKLKSIYVL